MTTIAPSSVTERANFVFDNDDILDVSNTIQTLKRNLSEVQLGIVNARKDLDDQRQIIIRMDQNLKEAEAGEKGILEAIARNEALLCPSAIRKLPTEILSEIFLHFLELRFDKPRQYPWHIYGDRPVWLSPYTILQSQNILLGVCRRWRRTMISDPRLWQTIPVFGNVQSYKYKGSTADHLEMLKERISKSGFTDLRVVFRMDESERASQPQLFQSALDLLHRTTIFEYSSIFETGAALPRPTEIYDRLKEVFLNFSSSCSGSWIHDVLQHAPNLQDLQSTAPAKFIPSSCLGNLLRLRLRFVELGEVSRILTHAQQLVDFEIHDLQRGHSTPSGIRHEHLLVLNIALVDFEFLEFFTLPGLRQLVFTRDRVFSDRQYRLEEWPTQAGLAFFERSNCKLTILDVADVLIVPELVDILRSQELLEDLYLDSGSSRGSHAAPVPNAVLDFLGAKPHEVRLTSLAKLLVYVKPIQMHAVQRMVATRTKRDDMAAFETCSVVVQTKAKGDAADKMRENHRRILQPVIEWSGLQLSYRRL